MVSTMLCGVSFLFFILIRCLSSPLGIAQSTPGIELAPEGKHVPETDDFYRAPLGLEKLQFGSIIRHRMVPRPVVLNGTKLDLDSSWHILYRSQDSIGLPIAAVTTLIKPKNAKPDHHFVQGFFTNAVFSECSPSQALLNGSRDDNADAQLQIIIALAALNDGFYVSVPDSDGPNAASSDGLQGGYATLDSIRAVQHSSNFSGLYANATTTMNGYSGGAFAIAWAAEIQPQYAPELNIAGAAIGGFPANLTYLLNDSPRAREYLHLAVPAAIGIGQNYPNMTKWLDENVIPDKKDDFFRVKSQCFDGNTRDFSNRTEWLGAFFKRGLDSFLYDPVPQSVLNASGIAGRRGKPTIPWYLYASVYDALAPINITDTLYDKFCAARSTIQYEQNIANVTHWEEGFLGFSNTFKWLRNRHAGKPVESGCSKTTYNISSITDVLSNMVPLFPAYILPTIMNMIGSALEP